MVSNPFDGPGSVDVGCVGRFLADDCPCVGHVLRRHPLLSSSPASSASSSSLRSVRGVSTLTSSTRRHMRIAPRPSLSGSGQEGGPRPQRGRRTTRNRRDHVPWSGATVRRRREIMPRQARPPRQFCGMALQHMAGALDGSVFLLFDFDRTGVFTREVPHIAARESKCADALRDRILNRRRANALPARILPRPSPVRFRFRAAALHWFFGRGFGRAAFAAPRLL